MKIVYIHALGCMTCMRMHEKILQLQDKTSLPIQEYNVDFDHVPFQNLGDYFPITIILKDHEELQRFVGEWELDELLEAIRGYQNE